MLLVVPQLVRPEFLLELEIIAAKAETATERIRRLADRQNSTKPHPKTPL
jgi:hypothetical protein